MKLTDEMLEEFGFYWYTNNVTKIWVLDSEFIEVDNLELREDKNFPKTLKELGKIINNYHQKDYIAEGARRGKCEVGRTLKEIIEYSNTSAW